MIHSRDFDQILHRKLEAVPFRPFTTELDDGEKLPVEHPRALMFPSFGSTVYFGPDGSIHFLDSEAVKQFVEAMSAAS